jgi:rhamnogalacturonan endolyase
MHDRQYRVAISWQNVGYNQPPHPGFYLGEGMSAPAVPDIVTSLPALGNPTPAVYAINRFNPSTVGTGLTSVTFRVTFNTPVSGVDASDFTVFTDGSIVGTVVSPISAQSAVAYNVTVGGITGTGLVRLDLNSSGTGIVAIDGGTPISGGFTSGQTYNRATLAWTRQITGGLWSDSANWDGGVIGEGIGSTPIFGNYDAQTDNTVALDSSRTVGGLNFGDTLPATAASWIVTDGGNAANVLTLDVASGNPVVTVGALGEGATTTLDVPLAGADGLAKAGAGTLVIAKPSAITGAVNVNGGTLRIGTGGTLASTSAVGIATGGSQLHVAGGTFTSSGLVTINAGSSIVLDSGTLSLNGGVRTGNADAATLRINGGVFTTSAITVQRNGTAAPNYTAGVIIGGGVSTVGTVGLGTNNSTGTLSVEGGEFTATGMVTVGNQSSGARGGAIRVIGGRLTSTDTANGIVLSRVNGTNANNIASLTVTAGVTTAEKLTFGFDSAVNAGSGTVRVNGGSLYLGSGGIVKNGTSGMTTLVELSSGVLGAKANWSTAHPLSLPADNTSEIRASSENGAPYNIALNGVISGAGGFTKTGAGMLTLNAANTFAGNVSVSDGALVVGAAGSLAPGGTLTIHSGGQLAGGGVVARGITVKSGGNVAPGISGAGTLAGDSLTWDGGATVSFDLGAGGDLIALSGTFSKGTAGAYTFAFAPLSAPAIGDVRTLATFGSTDFTAADFTASGLGYVRGDFAISGNALTFTVSSDGSGWTAFTTWAAENLLPAGFDGPSDDFDGDGSSNLLEFILGTDPVQAGPESISLVKVTEAGIEYPALKYTRRIARGDVKIETRAAATLDFAAPLGSVESSVTPVGNGTEIVIVRSLVPFSQEPRQFLRLVVTLP